MNIREKQLTLFPEFDDPVSGEGGIMCSLEHRKPVRAKYSVHFHNGNCRDVCGWCVKRFQQGGDSALIVKSIEKLKR